MASNLQSLGPAKRTRLHQLSIHPRSLLFILVSFEGPDRSSHAGGLGTRVTELSSALACQGFETYLFFIGDPALPGHKVARWDPEKGWGVALEALARFKHLGLQPTLLARGGMEPYEAAVLAEARRLRLSVVEAWCSQDDPQGLLRALREARDYDIINLKTFLSEEQRRILFRAADVVLANSGKEPFGLVGLEAMAGGDQG